MTGVSIFSFFTIQVDVTQGAILPLSDRLIVNYLNTSKAEYIDDNVMEIFRIITLIVQCVILLIKVESWSKLYALF